MLEGVTVVIGKEDNKYCNVKKDQVCVVVKESFFNGEFWYILEDYETGKLFESPSIFWEEIELV